MRPLPPTSTRTDTLFPCTTLFRSTSASATPPPSASSRKSSRRRRSTRTSSRICWTGGSAEPGPRGTPASAQPRDTTPPVGAASAASFRLGSSPCEGRGRLGGGTHGSRRCPKAPLPNPPLPSQGREQKARGLSRSYRGAQGPGLLRRFRRAHVAAAVHPRAIEAAGAAHAGGELVAGGVDALDAGLDRKSTRLNSSH